jgi:hypothetical protein
MIPLRANTTDRVALGLGAGRSPGTCALEPIVLITIAIPSQNFRMVPSSTRLFARRFYADYRECTRIAPYIDAMVELPGRRLRRRNDRQESTITSRAVVCLWLVIVDSCRSYRA